MRELNTDELENVAGGTGWLDHRVTDYGRSLETGEIVIGLADPLGNANTGYLGNNNNGALHSMIASGQVDVDSCGMSDFGPCQLPSGNYVFDGVVHGETSGNVAGEDVDWVGVGCDLAWIGGTAASGVTGGASVVVASAGAACNAVGE